MTINRVDKPSVKQPAEVSSSSQAQEIGKSVRAPTTGDGVDGAAGTATVDTPSAELAASQYSPAVMAQVRELMQKMGAVGGDETEIGEVSFEPPAAGVFAMDDGAISELLGLTRTMGAQLRADEPELNHQALMVLDGAAVALRGMQRRSDYATVLRSPLQAWLGASGKLTAPNPDDFTGHIASPIEKLVGSGVPIDVNALVQWVLRQAYLQNTEDLRFYAEKVRFYNELKKAIREETTAMRNELAKVAGDDADASLADPINRKNFDDTFVGETEVQSESELTDEQLAQHADYLAAKAQRDRAALLSGEYNAAIEDPTKSLWSTREVSAGDLGMPGPMRNTMQYLRPGDDDGDIKVADKVRDRTSEWVEQVVEWFDGLEGAELEAVIESMRSEGIHIVAGAEITRSVVGGSPVVWVDKNQTLRLPGNKRTPAQVKEWLEQQLEGAVGNLADGVYGGHSLETIEMEFHLVGLSRAAPPTPRTSMYDERAGAQIRNLQDLTTGEWAMTNGYQSSGSLSILSPPEKSAELLNLEAAMGPMTAGASGGSWTEGEPVTDKAGLEAYIKELEEKLSTAGDDAQLANVDLQNMLQKQQQTLQMMSNIGKMLHDTAMAIIRKIGG